MKNRKSNENEAQNKSGSCETKNVKNVKSGSSSSKKSSDSKNCG